MSGNGYKVKMRKDGIKELSVRIPYDHMSFLNNRIDDKSQIDQQRRAVACNGMKAAIADNDNLLRAHEQFRSKQLTRNKTFTFTLTENCQEIHDEFQENYLGSYSEEEAVLLSITLGVWQLMDT